MKMQRLHVSIGCLLAGIVLLLSSIARAQQGETTQPIPPEKPLSLTLVKAIMCEGMKEFEPQNETIIFSSTLGQAVCFTAFDPVPEKTEIYHNWIRRDQPDARFKLTLKPPRWATFSRITIHNADAGPWRVEITDANGTVLKTLRFSVTE